VARMVLSLKIGTVEENRDEVEQIVRNENCRTLKSEKSEVK